MPYKDPQVLRRAKAAYDKRKRAEAQALGLCTQCKKRPCVGTTSCDYCKARALRYYKKRMSQPEARKRINNLAVEYRIARKRKVYEAYGGFVCACCGNTREECLQIDHVNGGGHAHIKDLGSNVKLYTWIINNNYPPDFQILCANCNWIKRFLGRCDCQDHLKESNDG